MHRHTIPSFASSKSPFWPQLGSQETPHASHPETEVKRCLDITNVEQHELLGFDASRPLPDIILEWMNSLAVVEGLLSRFFQAIAAASTIRHVCQACSEVQAEKCIVFHASRQVNENLELFKKLEPGGQFQWERISSAVQPCRSLRESEAEPTISSQCSSFWGRERSLDTGRLWRAAQHSWTNGVSPFGLRQPSALGSDWRQEKVRLTFRLHTTSLDKDQPKYASLSASQWLSRAYPDPQFASMLNADLSMDHRPLASPDYSCEGSLKRQPTGPRQRKYS